MTKECDNTSVGVVIRDTDGRFALLNRARFPVGIAPAAGHIDDHGSPEQAALEEVHEEIGVALALEGLKKTIIYGRRVDNVCRRPGGDHHTWYIYEATVSADTQLKADKDETKGAGWYTPEQLQQLADRTYAYHSGDISEADWQTAPGLEEVWLPFMEELGFIHKEQT